MKKIIMGIASAALLCGSIFAADVSSGTKISGKLFNYGADGSIGLFSQTNDSHDYANPNFAFSIADEKAGASIKITTDGNANAVKDVTVDKDTGAVVVEWGNPKIDKTGPIPFLTSQTIWFKPIDMLKITVGGYDVALNKETIDWTESNTDLGGEGVLLSLDISGFALDLGFNQGDNAFWFTKPKEGEITLKNFFLKGAYNADFGSIGAYVSFNKGTKYWGSHTDHYVGDWTFGGKGIKGIDIGAGYKGAFGPVNAFANVIFYMLDGPQWLRPEIFASGGVGAFGFAVFAAPTIYIGDGIKGNKDPACEAIAKLTYGMNGLTPYFYFKSQNILAKTLGLTFKLGATGSVGLMGWDVCAQIDVNGKDVSVAVPFSLSVNF